MEAVSVGCGNSAVSDASIRFDLRNGCMLHVVTASYFLHIWFRVVARKREVTDGPIPKKLARVSKISTVP